MKRESKCHPIFTPSDSGLLMQVGSSSAFTIEDTETYAAIKAKSVALKALFEANGLSSLQSPTLNKLIEDAVALSDAWLTNRMSDVSFQHLLSAIQIDRITTAILKIRDSDSARTILSDLLNGSLDLLERKRSKAKDTLWELELLNTLRLNGIDAQIGEPDLVYSLSGPRVGIACKKFYSESNVAKVLSKAVAQIEKGFDFGIVALNIDDRLPKNAILKAPAVNEMADALDQRNMDFLRTHERHLRRYIEPGRAMSVLVSCAAIVDIESHKPRFLHARQSTMWHRPGLPENKELEMKAFYATFSGLYSND